MAAVRLEPFEWQSRPNTKSPGINHCMALRVCAASACSPVMSRQLDSNKAYADENNDVFKLHFCNNNPNTVVLELPFLAKWFRFGATAVLQLLHNSSRQDSVKRVISQRGCFKLTHRSQLEM